MTTSQQPIVHRRELAILDLIHRLPEHDRGNHDALIHAALRDELTELGYPEESYSLGKIHSDTDEDHGWSYLVDVTMDGSTQVARVTALYEELAAISGFRSRVADFAEHALQRLEGPGQQIYVSDYINGVGDRIDLWITDLATGEEVWRAQPLATCIDVLDAIDTAVERRARTVR